MFASAPPRRSAGVPWLEAGRRHHAGGVAERHVAAAIRSPTWSRSLLLAAVGATVTLVVRHNREIDRQRADAAAFAKAYAARDATAMWRALDAESQKAYPRARFAALVKRADSAATVKAKRLGTAGDPKDGAVTVPVAVDTRLFGTLRGTLKLAGRRRRRRMDAATCACPACARARHPSGARCSPPAGRRSSPATAPRSIDDPTLNIFDKGLRARYRERLAGTAGAELRFGTRMIAKVAPRAGRSVHSTLRPGLQRCRRRGAGQQARRRRRSSARAPATCWRSPASPSARPSRRGSTFKIITLAAALASGARRPPAAIPSRPGGTALGRQARQREQRVLRRQPRAVLRLHSCNSVFAPLGAQGRGAEKLVARAEAFGFNETPRIPVAKQTSTISSARDRPTPSPSARRRSAQKKDLATPLGMARRRAPRSAPRACAPSRARSPRTP